MNLRQMIAINIQNKRIKKGYSIHQLALKSHLTVDQIKNIEYKNKITFRSLEKIAKALNVDPYILLLPIEEDES